MIRQHLTFSCDGAQLVGTLDAAPGNVGLLIVTGGNETRAGAFGGQAELAARIAAAGFPVFRFDRRGVGDSEGENAGFRSSAPDIAAAIAAFRAAEPGLSLLVGFGNCDGASALMLCAGEGMDALVLANPWTIEEAGAAPPPQAIRARYSEKLRNPREIWRLLTGKVSFAKLAQGLSRALAPAPGPSGLAAEVAHSLSRFSGPVAILLAGRDRTAQIFETAWDSADPRIDRCADAGHAFAESDARDWLFERLAASLRGLHHSA